MVDVPDLPGVDEDRAVLLRIDVLGDTAATADLLGALLFDVGATAVEERDDPAGGRILLAGFGNRAAAEAALARLPRRPQVRAIVELPDDTWFDGWRAYATSHRAGRRLIVHPPWMPLDQEAGADDIVLHIDPGRAFGSGAHPTTRLVLAELEAQLQPGQRVLDVGCGSGVLTVAALRLGAAHVVAVDIDERAREATAANLARNGLGGADAAGLADGVVEIAGAIPTIAASTITASTEPATPGARPRFDLVLANIGANTVIELAPQLRAAGRRLVLSGFFAERAAEVLDAYARLEATPLNIREDGTDGWVALTLLTGDGG